MTSRFGQDSSDSTPLPTTFTSWLAAIEVRIDRLLFSTEDLARRHVETSAAVKDLQTRMATQETHQGHPSPQHRVRTEPLDQQHAAPESAPTAATSGPCAHGDDDARSEDAVKHREELRQKAAPQAVKAAAVAPAAAAAPAQARVQSIYYSSSAAAAPAPVAAAVAAVQTDREPVSPSLGSRSLEDKEPTKPATLRKAAPPDARPADHQHKKGLFPSLSSSVARVLPGYHVSVNAWAADGGAPRLITDEGVVQENGGSDCADASTAPDTAALRAKPRASTAGSDVLQPVGVAYNFHQDALSHIHAGVDHKPTSAQPSPPLAHAAPAVSGSKPAALVRGTSDTAGANAPASGDGEDSASAARRPAPTIRGHTITSCPAPMVSEAFAAPAASPTVVAAASARIPNSGLGLTESPPAKQDPGFEVKHLDKPYRHLNGTNRLAGNASRVHLYENEGQEITVWCSDDFQNMSLRSEVVSVVTDTLFTDGGGAGGTRDTAGCNHVSKIEFLIAKLQRQKEGDCHQVHEPCRSGDAFAVEDVPGKTNTGGLSVCPSPMKLLAPCAPMLPKTGHCDKGGIDDHGQPRRQRHLDLIVSLGLLEPAAGPLRLSL